MYAISVLRNVYQPDIQGESQPGFHNDFHGNIVEFETIEEAKSEIAEWESDRVVLSHNEYSAPDYIIVSDVTADYIQSGRNSDMSNYDWDGAECECGECQKCFAMMISQDRDYIRSHAK